jgi:hypothetical protein
MPTTPMPHAARAVRSAKRVAIATLLALATLPVLASGAAAHDVSGPCHSHRQEDESVRQHSRELIRCAARKWRVPGGAKVALCIAKRESGLLPWAESDDGLNKGLFQQHVRYWDGNYDRYTRPAWSMPTSILSGRTNTVVSIRMAADIGWGPWGGRRCG